jgi:hypothetical protein
MENKKIVNQMIDLHKKAFDQCFSTILTLQEQTENLVKTYLNHVPGISDEGIKVLDQCTGSYNKGLEELKKAIDEGYTKFEEFLDNTAMVTFRDQTGKMFDAFLNQKNYMPEEAKKVFEKLFVNYMNGSEEFKKYVDENIWCLKHFPPVAGKPQPQTKTKAKIQPKAKPKTKATTKTKLKTKKK